jgi:hypothetical protein
MNLFLRGAACAPLLALVAGCCANNANTCGDDLYADSLYFTLKSEPDSSSDTSYFSSAELDTIYLQRYTPARPATPANGVIPAVAAQPASALSDPVSIIRAKQTRTTLNSTLIRMLDLAKLPYTTVVISNNSPFPPNTTGGKLSAYNYLLTVQDKSVKLRHTYRFLLDSIQLKGQYSADGCTTCYQNTFKSFRVNNNDNLAPVVTETSGIPIATTLSKKEAK